MPVNSNGLTDKQDRFVAFYIIYFNAKKAAEKAGYQGTNGTLYAVGHENLRKPKIKAEIERRLTDYGMGAQEVLSRLALQAGADIGDFAWVENDADLANHPQSYLVKKFKRKVYTSKDDDTTVEIELELYDAHAALTDLGKYHALFTDKIKYDVDENLTALLKQLGALDGR